MSFILMAQRVNAIINDSASRDFMLIIDMIINRTNLWYE